jgi:hypothetical protein
MDLSFESETIRACGRFSLEKGIQGFHWKLISRAGDVWYWHADEQRWLSTCRSYHTEEEATTGLGDVLLHESAGDLDEWAQSHRLQ